MARSHDPQSGFSVQQNDQLPWIPVWCPKLLIPESITSGIEQNHQPSGNGTLYESTQRI